MKHAFLIIAHNQFKLLQALINLLDYEKNDIFVHIDRKSSLPKLSCRFSHLHLLPQRIDVRWGDYSQIEVELLLFKTALSKGPYAYYHLLSGVDLPLKTNDYIHNFFNENQGKEFIGFFFNNRQWIEKVNRYHLFTKYYKSNGIKANIINRIRPYCERLVNTIFHRKQNQLTFQKGPNWVSISHSFCTYLVEKEPLIKNIFRHTYCADEIFLQTIIWNSPFKDRIYNLDDEYNGCLREIDWNRGGPYTWGRDKKDLELLKQSNKIFARKFDWEASQTIIREIITFIQPSNHK